MTRIPTNSVLHCSNLKVTYSGQTQPQLKVDALTIEAGTCVVLCGPSGGGKSTLLQVVNGLIPNTIPATVTGNIQIAGEELSAYSEWRLSQLVGSVFQRPEDQLLQEVVVEELVFTPETNGVPRGVIVDALQTVSRQLQLEPLLEQTVATLSGGQRQKVALASVAMQTPMLYVFDEPTAHLDAAGTAQVQAAIRQLVQAGKTVLVAAHQLEAFQSVATRYLYLQEGEVRYDWSAAAFAALSEARRGELGLRPWQAPKVETTQPLTEGDLTVVLNRLPYLAQLAPEMTQIGFQQGIVTGIRGTNGIGKTTMAKALAGALPTKQATVTWQGRPMNRRMLWTKTAWVMEQVQLQLFFETVEKAITVGVSKEAPVAAVTEALGLTSLLHRHPLTLSGGQMQRVVVANAVLSNKMFYLFDEPTSGLDAHAMNQVADLIHQLRAAGRVVVVISHDDALLTKACDKVYQFEAGHR